MMNGNELNKILKQLKIDYLEFMQQTLTFFEPNKTGVLFSLLMEQDYLNQDQIMSLTGFSRTTVSDTLNKLMEQNSIFPVLQTRKITDKKKYYYCPLDFSQYMKTFVSTTFTISDFNIEFIPSLLHELKKIDPPTEKSNHVKGILEFYIKITCYFRAILDNFNMDWENFVKNPNYKPDIDKLSKIAHRYLIEHTQKEEKIDKIQNIKSINEIINIIVNKSLSLQSLVGRKKELGAILHTLFFEPEPITQDEIIKITNLSRSTISENLSDLVSMGFVETTKKPKDRKKYFKPKFKLQEYGISRMQLSNRVIDRIVLVLKNKFLKDLEGLPKNKETAKLEEFFKQNVEVYQSMKKYITIYFEAIKSLLET